MEIKVKDLLCQECDVDVIDDYDESLCIAFCGPIYLSEEGERHFKDALDVIIEFRIGDNTVTARLNEEKSYVRRAVKELFESAAGLCSESNWNKWFNDFYEEELMEIKDLVKRKYIVEIEGETHLPRMLEWKSYKGAGCVSVQEMPDVKVDNGTAFLMTVLAESISECDREADAQISDGFFENEAVTYVTPIM